MDSHAKSFAKAVSWRMMGFVLTTAAVWLATGRFTLAASIGAAEVVLKIGAFYVHERLWNRIDVRRTPGAREANV
jgi:uncharacterized membrane protein